MATIDSLLEKHSKNAFPNRSDSFQHIQYLAKQLGITHQTMGRVVHIAGTNGKGSTQRMLWVLLKASGKTCHLLTSPHVRTIHERIVLNNQPVTDEQLLAALIAVDEATDQPIGYFAILMLAAMLLFSQIPSDYVLLETGLGGEFDTTNCLADHAMSILTPIGLDHCELLGDTLEKIATTKARIQRANRPCIVAPQKPEAFKAIELQSSAIGSELLAINSSNYAVATDHFTLDNQRYHQPGLEGKFQMENAATVIKAYLTLIDASSRLTTDQINQALKQLYFPGRLHRIPEGKISQAVQHDLWIDGAHNAHAAQALMPFLEKQQQAIYLWCRFKANKDIEKFLSLLQPYLSQLIYQDDHTDGIADAQSMTAIANNLALPLMIAKNYQDAIEHLNTLASGLVLACGSLYWVGDLLNANEDGML